MGGLRFLPWVREGLTRVISTPDPLTGALPSARAQLSLSVTAQGLDTSTDEVSEIVGTTTGLLYGPGDVTGIDAQQVIRSFPAPGAENADVTLFAAVEFDRPDLPWLYTPASPDEQGRLRPWLVLVVVPVAPDGDTVTTVPGQALARLSTTVGELPALAESWAWAHAQVLLTTETEDVSKVIADAPERNLSRLICPRRLAADLDYVAAVVPAFAAGVAAGLGLPVDDDGPLVPAWGPGSSHTSPDSRIILPVYHHWTFRTGPDGDFESLSRRLRARPLPTDVGRRPVDVAAAGGGLPEIEPAGVEGRSVLAFEGALASPSMRPSVWDPAVADPWQATMRSLLEHADDRLTPPLYGEVHLQEGRVPPPGEQPLWLAGLNLDPRYRAAAALGTQVVQKHQEELAAAAWERAAQLREVNEQLRRGQAARDTAGALFAKRVDPQAPGRALRDDQLVALTQPVHDLVTPPAPGALAGPRAGRTTGVGRAADAPAPALDEVLDGNTGAKAATSPAFRRLARPRGPLARRLRPTGAAPAPLPRLAAGTSPVPAARIPAGGTVFDTLVPPGQGIGSLTRAAIEAAARNPWWHTSGGHGLAADRLVPYHTPTALAAAADDPVTTLASNGGDLLGTDRFFVAAADGRLFERRRLDEVWVWRDHGAPPGTWVATSGSTIAPDRVYVRGRDSRLWERRYDGDRWVWNDCGAPGGGLASRPNTAGNDVYVLGRDGSLYRFDSVGRGWVSLGAPQLNQYERLWGSPRPYPDGVYVATSGQRLFRWAGGSWGQIGAGQAPPIWGSPASYHRFSSANRDYEGFGFAYLTPTGELVTKRINLPDFHNHGRPGPVPPPPSNIRIVSLAQQTAQIAVDEETDMLVLAHPEGNPSDLRLYGRYEHYHDGHGIYYWYWHEIGRPANGLAPHRPGPVTGDERDGEVFVKTADGRLAALSWGYRGYGWVDHGTPADPRGTGRDDAPAPADRRFVPRVGLLSSLLVSYTVDEGAGSRIRCQLGHNVGEDGALRENDLTPAVAGPLSTVKARATATTVTGLLTADGRLHLIAVAALTGGRLAYWVGRDVDASGTATGGWTGPYELVDPVSPYASAVDVTVADLDGDGRPELVIGYAVSGPDPAANRVLYRVGWGLDDTGQVTRGWSDSLPTPYTFNEIHSIGVEIVDMTGDHVPDLLVFVGGRAVGGAQVARYFTGRGINRRGRVADSAWTGQLGVPDQAAVASGTGAGIAVADITGTRRPDLVVVYRSAINGLRCQVAFDLDEAGVPAYWSPILIVRGAADTSTGRGCAVTIADLRADLVADRARMGDAFMAAAANHQGRLAPAQALAHDDQPAQVELGPAANAVRGTVEPEVAVAGEVLAGLSVDGRPLVQAVPDTGDPMRRLLAGVTFDVPAYELLRGLSQENVVPNLPAVAPETMTALAANPRFIEAFLVGLNHEMSREMLWREFPADPRQTWFRQFWDVRGAMAAGAPLTDIPPLTDVAWRSGPLGTHLTAVGAPGEQSLVLVIRGEVLRRFPSTIVTMRRARWTGPQERETTGDDILPIFNAWLSPDLLLFGFPFTAEVARGAATEAAGDPGYFFVLREQPTAPRFGLDLEPEEWIPPTSPPPWLGEHWDDLHWGYLPAGARFLSPYAPGMPSDAVDGAVFGRTAADMARVALQRPVMLARHASDLLLPPEPR
ncbi:hypothetical protein GCM10027280_54460 [Micromonospora polyrhachis]|uniref:Uncharacterized protein n=1 Tax=Micromonospora polyrhachis TaxID=1282883 RepID=A0A7W7WSP1_9ACTN|nr:VCBS repeat-containing protein [Micromonospora polyrhachis]MBB4961832.1 hypothetical protein [Micromonospora polyrhachis]